MAVFTIGDLVTRDGCGSVGIIAGFDPEGDPYVEFILGRFADDEQPVLDYVKHFTHTKEEDL